MKRVEYQKVKIQILYGLFLEKEPVRGQVVQG